MGCVCGKSKAGPVNVRSSDNLLDSKTYSWSNKETINLKDYIVENEKGKTVVKLPGSVNGQQFIIQNCESCCIYVLDHCNTVTIDDCCDCKIFLGPTKGSVFVRNCHGCSLMIACQQFRSRDSKALDVYLSCLTQPIIESCSDIRFGCFSAGYRNLLGQFRSAGLSIFNNNWSKIHDFTPAEGGDRNWSLLAKDVEVEKVFPACDEVSDFEFTTHPSHSLVPQTYGYRSKISCELCVVVFFHDEESQKRALTFIEKMASTKNILFDSKECTLQPHISQRVFASSKYNNNVKKGTVIVLVYNGNGCITTCHEVAQSLVGEEETSELIYVSSNSRCAYKHFEVLFSSNDMQMSY